MFSSLQRYEHSKLIYKSDPKASQYGIARTLSSMSSVKLDLPLQLSHLLLLPDQLSHQSPQILGRHSQKLPPTTLVDIVIRPQTFSLRVVGSERLHVGVVSTQAKMLFERSSIER